MATINANLLSEALASVVDTACGAAGDEIALNGGSQLLMTFKNGAGVAQTVTVAIQSPNVNDPVTGKSTKSPLVLAIPAAGSAAVFLKNPSPYLNSVGRVALTYSAVATLTVNPMAF
jgi:hypothetical protein